MRRKLEDSSIDYASFNNGIVGGKWRLIISHSYMCLSYVCLSVITARVHKQYGDWGASPPQINNRFISAISITYVIVVVALKHVTDQCLGGSALVQNTSRQDGRLAHH